jgi:hypothetical protein
MKKTILVASLAGCVWGFSFNVLADARSSYNDRWLRVTRSCIVPSMQNVKCDYEENNAPFKKDSTVGQMVYQSGYGTSFRALGWARRSARVLGMLFDIEDSPYWDTYEARLGYKSLKNIAVNKAKRESLSSCQRACLATCISSYLIDYDDDNSMTHWTDSVGSQTGVCREYAAIANDFMKSLKLKSKVVTGYWYENMGGTLQKEGGHAMVEVQLGRASYIMEPQDPFCTYYDPKFRAQARPIIRKNLNHIR